MATFIAIVIDADDEIMSCVKVETEKKKYYETFVCGVWRGRGAGDRYKVSEISHSKESPMYHR